MTKARTLADNFAADINQVDASAPLTGGGTSGTVTVGIQDATTSQKGAVQLEDSTASTSTTKAATPNSVKSAYDLADGAIAKSLVDAKGDLLAGSADNTLSILSVGANDTVLTADSSTATGLKWAAIPAASFVGVRVNNGSTSHSIPNNTNTALTWNAENYDSDGFHSTATNTSRLTVPSGKAGYYKIWGCNVFDVDATGRRTAQIQVNGTTYITRDEPTASASAYPGAVVTTTYYLNDGDYVEYVVFQTSGTTMGLPNSASSANFGMERLG